MSFPDSFIFNGFTVTTGQILRIAAAIIHTNTPKPKANDGVSHQSVCLERGLTVTVNLHSDKPLLFWQGFERDLGMYNGFP